MAKRRSGSGGGGGHGGLVIGFIGLAAGYLLSPMIARFSPIKPFHG